MGLRNALRLATAAQTVLPSPLEAEDIPPAVRVAFGLGGGDVARVSRADAMTIPAVRRGRSIIAGIIGTAPMIATRGSSMDRVPRPLLEAPEANTTRQHWLTWTVDDLLFYGVSWSLVTLRDAQGFPMQVRRLRHDQVAVDLGSGRVYVDGKPADDRDLIRFDGPDEGVLNYGYRTLRTALLLDEAVRRFARLEIPLGVLKLKEGARELSQPDVEALVDTFEAARQERNTAYLNAAVDYETVAFDAERVQLAEARQFQAVEIARMMNLSPRWVAAPSGDSMTYSNVAAERRDLVDTSLASYVAALEQRLTMGDVTPRGHVVRLDLSEYLRGDTLTALQAAEVGVRIGATTADEVRASVLALPALPPKDNLSTSPFAQVGLPALIAAGVVTPTEARKLLGLDGPAPTPPPAPAPVPDEETA